MVETNEAEGYDSDTGERAYRRWHSCPRYLGPRNRVANVLLYLVTLAMDRTGHTSHAADQAILERRYR